VYGFQLLFWLIESNLDCHHLPSLKSLVSDVSSQRCARELSTHADQTP
jgi:hypothetical protein